MKRKIFININIPKKTKKSLARATEKWQDLPVKWVKEDNLHITLSFLGFVYDHAVVGICEKVQEAVEDMEMIDLEFEKIELAPDKENPKMVWLSGVPSEGLRILHEKIEKALNIFVSSKKSFAPHITLGKIRQHKWQELEAVPEIEKTFPLMVTVESVDIMASEFEGDGMEYVVIESCLLK